MHKKLIWNVLNVIKLSAGFITKILNMEVKVMSFVLEYTHKHLSHRESLQMFHM